MTSDEIHIREPLGVPYRFAKFLSVAAHAHGYLLAVAPDSEVTKQLGEEIEAALKGYEEEWK